MVNPFQSGYLQTGKIADSEGQEAAPCGVSSRYSLFLNSVSLAN